MNETKGGTARLLSAAVILGVLTIAGCGAPDASAEAVAVRTEKLDLTAP
jgi:outer membrane murein-binding lipoprotein Lpp